MSGISKVFAGEIVEEGEWQTYKTENVWSPFLLFYLYFSLQFKFHHHVFNSLSLSLQHWTFVRSGEIHHRFSPSTWGKQWGGWRAEIRFPTPSTSTFSFTEAPVLQIVWGSWTDACDKKWGHSLLKTCCEVSVAIWQPTRHWLFSTNWPESRSVTVVLTDGRWTSILWPAIHL